MNAAAVLEAPSSSQPLRKQSPIALWLWAQPPLATGSCNIRCGGWSMALS